MELNFRRDAVYASRYADILFLLGASCALRYDPEGRYWAERERYTLLLGMCNSEQMDKAEFYSLLNLNLALSLRTGAKQYAPERLERAEQNLQMFPQYYEEEAPGTAMPALVKALIHGDSMELFWDENVPAAENTHMGELVGEVVEGTVQAATLDENGKLQLDYTALQGDCWDALRSAWGMVAVALAHLLAEDAQETGHSFTTEELWGLFQEFYGHIWKRELYELETQAGQCAPGPGAQNAWENCLSCAENARASYEIIAQHAKPHHGVVYTQLQEELQQANDHIQRLQALQQAAAQP